jgi:hypothetical protein
MLSKMRLEKFGLYSLLSMPFLLNGCVQVSTAGYPIVELAGIPSGGGEAFAQKLKKCLDQNTVSYGYKGPLVTSDGPIVSFIYFKPGSNTDMQAYYLSGLAQSTDTMSKKLKGKKPEAVVDERKLHFNVPAGIYKTMEYQVLTTAPARMIAELSVLEIGKDGFVVAASGMNELGKVKTELSQGLEQIRHCVENRP